MTNLHVLEFCKVQASKELSYAPKGAWTKYKYALKKAKRVAQNIRAAMSTQATTHMHFTVSHGGCCAMSSRVFCPTPFNRTVNANLECQTKCILACSPAFLEVFCLRRQVENTNLSDRRLSQNECPLTVCHIYREESRLCPKTQHANKRFSTKNALNFRMFAKYPLAEPKLPAAFLVNVAGNYA